MLFVSCGHLHWPYLGQCRKKHRNDADEQDTSGQYIEELRKLKAHLSCAKHSGAYCYISPDTQEHIRLSTFMLTAWAKHIVCPLGNTHLSSLSLQSLKQASVHKPPNFPNFVTSRKRTRRTAPSPPLPLVIHIHIPPNLVGSTSAASPSHHPSPQGLPSIPTSDNSEPLALYLPTARFLSMLTGPHEDFLQYLSLLTDAGYDDVQQIEEADAQALYGLIDDHYYAAAVIREEAARFVRRVRKGKGRAA